MSIPNIKYVSHNLKEGTTVHEMAWNDKYVLVEDFLKTLKPEDTVIISCCGRADYKGKVKRWGIRKVDKGYIVLGVVKVYNIYVVSV